MRPHDAIPFSKYHGLGNDFVLIDAISRADLADLPWSDWAASLCDRHTGLGADGLLILARMADADASMRVLNADGSDGGMCGNGVRCVARHMVERHGVPAHSVRVRVGQRLLTIACSTHAGEFLARVVMGRPTRSADGEDSADLAPEAMSTDLLAACGRAAPGWREASGAESVFVRVHMPNPHAVLFCRRVADVPLEAVGPLIETHGVFPYRTNVQFVEVVSRSHARIRTWERGAGPTRACGTGACAAVVAGAATGRLDREAEAELPGGRLRIAWDPVSGQVVMTGPASWVYDGVFAPPNTGPRPLDAPGVRPCLHA